MPHAGLHENLKKGLCTEYADTAAKIENIMVNPKNEKCSYHNIYGNIPKKEK